MLPSHADAVRHAFDACKRDSHLNGPLRGGANDRVLIAIFEEIKLRASVAEMRALLDFLERKAQSLSPCMRSLIVIELKQYDHELNV